MESHQSDACAVPCLHDQGCQAVAASEVYKGVQDMVYGTTVPACICFALFITLLGFIRQNLP